MSQIILLLKEKTLQPDSNVDVYEQKFSELGNYKILYLPLLEHSLVNINELISILRNGTDNKYGGVIVTSQRAVEGLRVAWEQAFFSSGKYNSACFSIIFIILRLNRYIGEMKDALERWKRLPYFVV